MARVWPIYQADTKPDNIVPFHIRIITGKQVISKNQKV